MKTWKIAGKWALYIIGALIAFALYDSMTELQKFAVGAIITGLLVTNSITKQRNADKLHFDKTTEHLYELISRQETEMWKLQDRINALEVPRTRGEHDDG